jgi:hypothetical protein
MALLLRELRIPRPRILIKVSVPAAFTGASFVWLIVSVAAWYARRAVVVGCAVSATRNYLKLHMPRTLKVLLCNAHAKPCKLWKHSARLPPLKAIPVDQSRPLLNFTRLPRYPLHHLRFPGMQTLHVASCARRAYHRERRRH